MEAPLTRDHYVFWIPVTVRWGDMDSLGHVNNAKYFPYLESVRTAFFDAVKNDPQLEELARAR